MSKIFQHLASPILMGILAFLLAAGCAVATFIENDYGTPAARQLVYNALWFELLLLLIALNLCASMFHRKLYQSKTLSIFLIHIGFVVIIIGAGVTRYTGVEGMLHIREGQTAQAYHSSGSWLRLYSEGNPLIVKEVDFALTARNRFKASTDVGSQKISVTLNEYIPNAIEALTEHPDGTPVISLVLLSDQGSGPLLLAKGKTLRINGNSLGFESDEKADVSFVIGESGLMARSLYPVSKRGMEMDTLIGVPPGEWFPIESKIFYRTDNLSFAFRGLHPKARVAWVPNPEHTEAGRDYISLNVCLNSTCQQVYIPLTTPSEPMHEFMVAGMPLAIAYGPKSIPLPFRVRLNKFVLEKYPGSESPSSFTSYVEVYDSADEEPKPYAIFMNNILRHKGIRLFQSSYDTDLKGTHLSVNNDPWGTGITYTGYFILILGMIWALFAPASRFRSLLKRSVTPALILVVGLASLSASAQSTQPPLSPISREHAREYGQLMVQNVGGRTKPLSTLASETLRKLNRSNRFMGLSPEQVFLSITAFPEQWQQVPIIRVSSHELRELLGIKGEHAAFADFFTTHSSHSYKLAGAAQKALAIKPAQRTALEKDVLKVNERLNILYMALSGQIARIFPEPNHPENRWFSMAEASEWPDTTLLGQQASRFASYISAVRGASRSGSWDAAQMQLDSLMVIQQLHGGDLIPSQGRVKAEVWINRFIPFERLIPLYGISGFILLIICIFAIVAKKQGLQIPILILAAFLLLGLLVHTFGIGLRWYIAGRAPLSNSYETMVYIAWAAMIGGFAFAKRSKLVLPSTALLATLVLFVAHLSWMDPQITNLVPVLKSYWLTIHVGVITASYGFFGMSAILGLVVMILLSLQTTGKRTSIEQQVKEITVINELSLTLGLYLLTAGCFLGAVWANESWGRYWGWDPKETWTLITIVVYTFILHMRLIPGLRSHFSFNFAALLGIGSVLMTYFGVNYYLSGLHSYAGGDAPPIPSWLPFAVLGVLSLGGFAWFTNQRVSRQDAKDSN